MKSSDEHLSPGEKVYPLKFLCDYVMQRREELTNYETQDLKEAIQIMQHLERLVGRIDAECSGGKAQVPREALLAARALLRKIRFFRFLFLSFFFFPLSNI